MEGLKPKELLKEYYRLCNKHKVSFPWNFDGLIKHPENIKVDLVRKGIKEIRESYNSPMPPATLKSTNKKKIERKSKQKKSGTKRLGKEEMHLTTVPLDRRSESKKGNASKKSKKKRKINKKKATTKKKKVSRSKSPGARIVRGGLPRQ